MAKHHGGEVGGGKVVSPTDWLLIWKTLDQFNRSIELANQYIETLPADDQKRLKTLRPIERIAAVTTHLNALLQSHGLELVRGEEQRGEAA
ncbi:MAG TPA: hypothetical protein DEP35_13135 [Deltaproteobacteria bacterium]|nr:hypothetical protein [Deltaproteobacteria bacterium]